MAADDYLDAETRETLAAGRRTAGDMVGAAQSKGRRIFVVFTVGLLGTVYALRAWIWPILERDLLATGAEIIAITPFDVILLQAKIGILVGVLLSIPPFLYYAREPLKRRGYYPEDDVPSWKLAVITLLSGALFVGGVVYSYTVFFPVMFDFLATNALSAGLAPTYSIVDWTQFILVLGLSFGLAAQLPLAMTALAYADIVSYETFRDKWKYAVVATFGFGALFSPPDPFTQLMWAGPLIALYGFSLYLTKLAVALKRGREALDITASIRANSHRLAGLYVLVAGGIYWFLTVGYGAVNRGLIPVLPAAIRPGLIRPAQYGIDGPGAAATVGGLVGILAVVVMIVYVSWPEFETRPGRVGDPTAIDLDTLDAAGVRAAPAEVFAELTEEEAIDAASDAIDADEPAKARAILDRFDAIDSEGDAAETAPAEATDGAVTRATTDVVNAVAEDERSEEEIGGYYYDLAFVVDSLRSKMFRLFVVFIVVLVSVFSFLYSGGIGAIKNDFLRRLPAAARPEEVSVITLHPVEALVFEVKIATLLGAIAVLPLVLYYAWPALSERGLASGDRNVFFGWSGAIVGGLVFGSAIGYLYIAPGVVSYLVWDALRANMIIAYRVSNFFWLIFFTTIGIGLLLDIPVTMFMFCRGGIASYGVMRDRWREVTLAVMAFAAIFTPATVLSMVLVTLPVMAAYGLGLVVLWVYTLGGQRAPRPAGS